MHFEIFLPTVRIDDTISGINITVMAVERHIV